MDNPAPTALPFLPAENLQDFFSQEELQELLSKDKPSDFLPLEFIDPVEMFETIYPDVFCAEDTAFNQWQRETNLFIADKQFTKKNPLEISIAAANGSGKDAYVIAIVTVFLAACRCRQRIVITSASYTQLKLQTEASITDLARRVNKFCLAMKLYDKEPFYIKKDHIINSATGSEIILFVTDEVGRAEGYHPWKDHPDSAVCVILNEAKTVPDEIFEALSRCTYSRWIEVSSPGRMGGKFHKHCISARRWEEGYESGKRIFRRISSYDCPHISRSKIESDKFEMGENSPLFRSKHLALFTSIDENVVIPAELVERASRRDNPTEEIFLEPTCGIDLAAGGDENALYCYKGNFKVHELFWRERDTVETANTIVRELKMLETLCGLKDFNVCIDNGNMGISIIDMIKRQGWNVLRVNNQSSAFNSAQFANRGAEMWFNGRRLFEECRIKLDPEKDKKLIEQLSSRYYKQSETLGKFALESKKEARANGHGSPDRADAWMLCQMKNSVRKFLEKGIIAPITKSRYLSQEELIKEMDREKFAHLLGGIGNMVSRDIGCTQHKESKTHPSNILRNLYEEVNL